MTSDHGGQPNYQYLGNGQTAKWGKLLNDSSKPAPKWVSHFSEGGEVELSLQDSAIRVWLKPNSDERKVIERMRTVPGITEIYQLSGGDGKWKYAKQFSNPKKQSASFEKWAEAHNTELLNAYATETAPNIVGLLEDNTGFDLIGDHGGAQEKVQRIPLIIYEPGQRATIDRTPTKLYEVGGIVSKAMDLATPNEIRE